MVSSSPFVLLFAFLCCFVGLSWTQTSNCNLVPCDDTSFNVTCCCTYPCLETAYTLLNNVDYNLWTIINQFFLPGSLEVNGRMFIVKVDPPGASSFLVLINGIKLCNATLSALKALEMKENAPILHVTTTGDFHWLYLGDYVQAFPNAKVWIPPGRIQRVDPVGSKLFHIIDMSNPFSFLLPSIQTISWSGLCAGPVDGPTAKLPRNEFIFYLPNQKTIIAGDTLFYRACGLPVPGAMQFNPQGLSMVLDIDEVRDTVLKILKLDFERAYTVHGELGSLLLEGAKQLVFDAYAAVFA